jgi:hypothetical protein
MANLFKNLEQQAFRAGVTPRTTASAEWFRKKAAQLGTVNRRKLMNTAPMIKEYEGIVGSMQMFFYSPKHKKTLPFYDKFPLVVVVGPAEGGFYGLNLHYLPPVLRAKMLDALLGVTNNKRYDESTKFKMSYDMLRRAGSMKYYKPCFKHYLNDHVSSNFARVPAPEFEIAVFLPTASWSGASESAVYKNSRKQIK